MQRKGSAFLAAVMILLTAAGASAQNGKSTTTQGTAPNGRPFVALQTQIDSFSQSIEDLEARWQEAEARLDEHADSLQALVDADLALQELIAELRHRVEGLEGDVSELAGLSAELDALKLEVSQKQAAILQACPSGSSIRQINDTGTVVCEVDDAGAGSGAPLVLSDFTNPANLLVAAGGNRSAFMSCPSGYRPISGGYIKGGALQVMVNVPESNGWRVAVGNPTATDSFVRVVVRCVAP